jgi:hypothetical protein
MRENKGNGNDAMRFHKRRRLNLVILLNTIINFGKTSSFPKFLCKRFNSCHSVVTYQSGLLAVVNGTTM